MSRRAEHQIEGRLLQPTGHRPTAEALGNAGPCKRDARLQRRGRFRVAVRALDLLQRTNQVVLIGFGPERVRHRQTVREVLDS